ncbi:MAG: bifunctional folylpolyglutamate synthase/dihydrofolate synthase [Bacilli bacterium]
MNDLEIKEYLYNIGGASKGIDNFKNFLSCYGNPEEKVKCIHVLGTNGKGSTTVMLAKILQTKYKKVGTFTSPAFLDVYDRIQINRIDIEKVKFNKIFNLIYQDTLKYHLGFFEILCAIAFIYYDQEGVDYMIIEAGVGGKYDCTSVINPDVRLLTNVGYDHIDVLGNTLDDILMQKLGACRNGDNLITTISKEHYSSVIEYCKQNNITYVLVNKIVDFNLSLQGIHQKINASLVYECIRFLNINISLNELAECFKNVSWQGRFEKLKENIYLDGAHNIDGIKVCLQTANDIFGKNNYNIVSSILYGKDIKTFNKEFKNNGKTVVFTTFDYKRAYNINDLLHEDVNVCADFKTLIDQAYINDENYLFVGSLYFVTEIHKYLRSRK